jgi:Zn-dependent M28 family amino/carboxypeptidase
MKKNSVKLIICSLLVLATGFSAVAQGDWKKENDRALALITREGLHREISFLTDSICNGRGTGTAGASEAAFWIARKFQKAGLLPATEGFASHFSTPTGACGHNILGIIPGALTQPRDRYIIVGAHYDHLGVLNGRIFPGADANASGTVALTALADIFGEMKLQGKVYDSNILFVAFDAKEMGMSGSAALWKLIEYSILKDPITGKAITKDKITAMVNIDQIGSTLSPVNKDREDYLLMIGTHSLPASKRMNLEACNMLHNINLDICLSYYGSKTFTDVFYKLSDQKVFVENRIPAVFFTSGITMNTNKTRDVVENLNISVLEKRIRLIYYWVESML